MSRLLLIDDDARLTSMVADYLRGHGFEVQVADTLGNGREHLAREAFDGLVLDLMLPDGDGLDLTRELRTQPRTRRRAPELRRMDAFWALLWMLLLLFPLFLEQDFRVRLLVSIVSTYILGWLWDAHWKAIIGGLNGDVLGAGVELRELLLLAVVAASP